MMAIALDEKERETRKGKKRVCVHDILKRRKVEGEFYTSCTTLEDHEENFFIYFRICSYQFILKNIALSKIKNDITNVIIAFIPHII